MANHANLYKILIVALLSLSNGNATAETPEHNEFTLEDFRHARQGRRLGYEFFNYLQEQQEQQQQQQQQQQQSANKTFMSESRASLGDLQCVVQLNALTTAMQQGSIWALRVIDSWGSIPTGILYGNLRDLGNYDECLRLNREVNSQSTIQGKYCTASLPVGKLLSVNDLPSIRTAVCMPAACSADLINILLKEFLKRTFNLNMGASVNLLKESSCRVKASEPLSGAAIATIVIMSTMGGLVLLATLADYYCSTGVKKLHALVYAFSLRHNARQLFRIVDYSGKSHVIPCLNGIRCLSLIWVIFCHRFMQTILTPMTNYYDLYYWLQTPFSMLITEGFVAVDTFFFLSALLLTMGVMRELEKKSGKLNLPLMYLHRYLRLTPLLGFAMLVFICVNYLGDGPLWEAQANSYSNPCKRNWWVALLYIQNYFRTHDKCAAHTWYLAVDMQLYILSPAAIIALRKWGKKAVAGIVLLLLLTWACLFSSIMINNYAIFFKKLPEIVNSMPKIYFPTHMRTSPWIIGLLFGYYLHLRRGRRVPLPMYAVLLGWLSCFALIATTLFALYPKGQIPSAPLTTLDSALYISLSRIAWPLALCWLVFGCYNGYGGPIDSFLSSPLWQPLARISYCMYLFHLIIIITNDGQIRTIPYFSSYNIMLKFWSDFGFTVLMSVFFYLLIESPFAGIEQFFFFGSRQSKPKEPMQRTLTAPQVATVQPAAAAPATTEAHEDKRDLSEVA